MEKFKVWNDCLQYWCKTSDCVLLSFILLTLFIVVVVCFWKKFESSVSLNWKYLFKLYFILHFSFFIFKGLFRRTILVSGSLLSPSSRIISSDLVREEISRQMACHLDVEGIDLPTTTTSNNSSEPSNVLRDISNCLDRKPIEALLGIRLPFVR